MRQYLNKGIYDWYAFQMERELKIRNYSPRTVRSYTGAFQKYRVYVRKRGEHIDFLNQEIIKDFLLYKKEQNCSPRTLNLYLCAIKFFYREIMKNPQKTDIKFAKRNRKIPIVLEHEEIMDIICTFQNLKYKLIICLAYGSGLRISETTNLKIGDLNFREGIIHIKQGKGQKDRITVLPKSLIPELNQLIKNRAKNDYLFISNRKTYYSTRTLQKIFKIALEKAEIHKQATFHSLRHSFAIHLLDEGVNLRYIQELLGHQSIRTTQIYTKMTVKGLKNISSPL